MGRFEFLIMFMNYVNYIRIIILKYLFILVDFSLFFLVKNANYILKRIYVRLCLPTFVCVYLCSWAFVGVSLLLVSVHEHARFLNEWTHTRNLIHEQVHFLSNEHGQGLFVLVWFVYGPNSHVSICIIYWNICMFWNWLCYIEGYIE